MHQSRRRRDVDVEPRLLATRFAGGTGAERETRGDCARRPKAATQSRGLSGDEVGYCFLSTRSLSALATVNLQTVLAGIWMASPVAGFRPMRALRC